MNELLIERQRKWFATIIQPRFWAEYYKYYNMPCIISSLKSALLRESGSLQLILATGYINSTGSCKNE